MIILAVDPGTVNIGMACYDTDTNEFIDNRRTQICTKQREIKSEYELTSRIYQHILTPGSLTRNLFDVADIVLIEIQMKRKFIIFQHVLATFCFSHQKAYRFVAPQSIKYHFNLSRKSHKANKLAAIEYTTKRFATIMTKFTKAKRDDIADALLMCIYWSEVHVQKLKPPPPPPRPPKLTSCKLKQPTKRKRKPTHTRQRKPKRTKLKSN